MTLWKKIIEEKLDEIDLKILNLLITGRELTDEEIKEMAKKLGIYPNKLKDRIAILRGKRILLKTNSALVDPVKLWDVYLIVFIKAHLSPPVVGVEIDYPRGWTEIIDRMNKAQKKLRIDIVRQAYTLQGTEWDLLLIITAQDLREYQEFAENLIKQGWVEKMWSFRPLELKSKWFFDPTKAPPATGYEKNVKRPFRYLK